MAFSAAELSEKQIRQINKAKQVLRKCDFCGEKQPQGEMYVFNCLNGVKWSCGKEKCLNQATGAKPENWTKLWERR